MIYEIVLLKTIVSQVVGDVKDIFYISDMPILLLSIGIYTIGNVNGICYFFNLNQQKYFEKVITLSLYGIYFRLIVVLLCSLFNYQDYQLFLFISFFVVFCSYRCVMY